MPEKAKESLERSLGEFIEPKNAGKSLKRSYRSIYSPQKC